MAGSRRAEFGVEIAREAAPAAAHLIGNLRDGRQAPLERPEIETRAAGHDGEQPLLPGRLDLARASASQAATE